MLLVHSLARWLTKVLVGTPPPRVPPGVRKADAAAARMPAFIPDVNPLDADGSSSMRAQDAMTMMDPDCFGYLLLTVHKEPEELVARIQLAEQIQDSWWPAIAVTCEEIAAEARRVV